MAVQNNQKYREVSRNAWKRTPYHNVLLQSEKKNHLCNNERNSLLSFTSGSDRMSSSSRQSSVQCDTNINTHRNDRFTSVQSHLPLAIQYLNQVTLNLSVTKRHTDVRYVMSVKHTELDLTWRHARSFDEYRKLQQRLLKKLQHGHFCDADCPWLYGFLKSYFPKKLVFTISSARVVEQRKETLERFFSALNGFLIDKKNLSCSVLTTVFADELVKFIYEDALQQYGLENPIKSTVLEKNRLTLTGRNNLKWKEPVTPMKKRLLECESKQQQQYDRSSLLTNSTMDSITDDNIVNDLNSGNCGICGSPLCGVAHGNSPSSTEVGGSPFSENTSNNNSSVFSLPWSRTPTTNGSRRSGNANDFGGSRRSKGSASRRRAATYYLTTLSCSHQFHDECIVPKLNEALECPTCGRIQTKL